MQLFTTFQKLQALQNPYQQNYNGKRFTTTSNFYNQGKILQILIREVQDTENSNQAVLVLNSNSQFEVSFTLIAFFHSFTFLSTSIPKIKVKL